MSREELIKHLNDLAVKPDRYSLDAKLVEGIVIDRTTNHYLNDKKYDEWRVFVNERGTRYDEKIFYKEEDAFDDLYRRFKKRSV